MREIALRKWVRRNVCVGHILSRKEIAAGPRRPEASMAEAGGGVEGGAILAYLERLLLSMCFAAPPWLIGDSVGCSMYSDAPGVYDDNFGAEVQRNLGNDIMCNSVSVRGSLADDLLHRNNIVRIHFAEESTEAIADVVMTVCPDGPVD